MPSNNQQFTIDDISALMKRRGFVFPSSEIYGGWESAYDFGPLGAEVLRNLRNLWWKHFVHARPEIVGLDSAIISHPRVWEASGHVESFADVMVEDVETHKRYRADHLIEDALPDVSADGLSPEEIDTIIEDNKLKSPDGNPLSKAKRFNNLVEVQVGTMQDAKSTAYLRGETCQAIFYNYDLVRETQRMKLPFGIAQIGKAFRNEIKVGPFIFRTREFEQMEMEVFTAPTETEAWFDRLKEESLAWVQSLGVNPDKLRYREQEFQERAHYNKVAHDLEYEFPFGWKEFQGIHNRGDWDLKRHGEYSNTDFTYTDPESGEKYIPHIAEYSIGLNRLLLVLMCDAYRKDEKRTWLALHPKLAPYQVAVFPLLRNKEELVGKAREIYLSLLAGGMHAAWDDRGNIGKRYLAQDEIGTPFCVTVDFDTLEDAAVTIRERDSMSQERIPVDKIAQYVQDKVTNS
jgi:glycyl-tRNA synthetase